MAGLIVGSSRLAPLTPPNCRKVRSHAGLQAARASKDGRPIALNKDKQALAVKLYEEKQHTVGEICTLMGVSKPTLYKCIDYAKSVKDPGS
ncbi:helix-turn-helix domain-containing protein [Microbulbifer epialgicus]|uniref:Helix-turn-helix domain-containing protein n=1 Tax=Microbulbifer epialgicus TaxID=393907 RepID=A0ABV4NZA7_9GAMM